MMLIIYRNLKNPSYDYGDYRHMRESDSDDSDLDEDAYARRRMERSFIYYQEDKENERKKIEKYLKRKLKFIPNLKLTTWADY